MRKEDYKLLGYIAAVYLLIVAIGTASSAALMSLAISILIVSTGLAVYCNDKTCIFTK